MRIKLLLTTLFCFLGILSFAQDNSNFLIGKWVSSSIDDIIFVNSKIKIGNGYSLEIIYTFNKDGTGRMVSHPDVSLFKWRIENDLLIFTYTDREFIGMYKKINDNTIVLFDTSNEKNIAMIIVLKRR